MNKQPNYRVSRKVKFISTFLLVIFLNSICFPTISWAALTSVHQVEYTSYETAQNTDMVDLLTGDFTYTLPLLNVPGPEGGFSMPLAYHGGIELDEEASWVGLGWSFNPGAIVRSVNQYPDDFDGQNITSDIYNTGGDGYSINFLIGSYTYDSEKGSGGRIGLGTALNLGFGTESGIQAVGVKYNSIENKVTADPIDVASAIFTIASIGTASAFKSAATSGEPGAATGAAINSVANIGVAVAASSGSSVTNINDWTFKKDFGFFKSTYNYYLDYTKTEDMFGSLYYGQILNANGIDQQDKRRSIRVFNGSIPSSSNYHNYSASFYKDRANNYSNITVSSDMYSNINSTDPLEYQIYSSNITYDSYNVMGAGISGPIEPYRLDVGFLALPFVDDDGVQYAHSQFSQSGMGNEKVDFRYLGEKANYYKHNLGKRVLSGSPYHDYQTSIGAQLITVQDLLVPENTYASYPTFLLDDPILYDPTDRIESDRNDGSYASGKLTKPKHIKWFTNAELGYSGPPNLIGGYEVTSKDGLTYHYKQPVYNTYQMSYEAQTSSNYNITKIEDDYPITWLLTGITGSDYVDRGPVGISNEDWGYWVELDYGKVSSNFTYRHPYYGQAVPDLLNGLTWATDKFNLGQRETYYLNTIKTRTHTALFIKETRQDGRSAKQADVSNAGISTSLKLNEVVVLSNNDFNTLVSSPLSLSKNSGNNQQLSNNDVLSNVFDVRDMSPSIQQFIKDNQISKTVFNYKDYTNSLCMETLNSFTSPSSSPNGPTNSGGGGKLTLSSISQYGRNDFKLMPDYLFDYNTPNPNYHYLKKDAWGMYQSSTLTGTDLVTRKSQYPNVDSKGDEWSLNKITTPLGGELLIDYERDDYASVSGYPTKMKFILDNDYSETGVLKSYYKDIDFTDYLSVGQQIEVHASVNFDCDYSFNSSVNPVAFPTTQTITAVSENSIIVDNPPPFPTPDPGDVIGGDDPCPNSTLVGGRYIIFDVNSKKGGQNRVKSIAVIDESGNEYSTVYRYTIDGLENGKSSGVIAKEPSSVRGVKYNFYNYYDYPNTPIIYKNVTIFNGKSGSNIEESKVIYEFGTPHYSMVEKRQQQVFDGKINFLNPGDDHFKFYNFNININTSELGQLKSVKQYTSKNQLISQIIYNYIESDIGRYSSGSLTSRFSYFSPDDTRYYNLLRTTKDYQSNILASVSIINNNEKTLIENTKYDISTGAVIETEYKDSWGNKFRTESVPAYKKYSEMGSKYVNDLNHNMMSQPAAEYLYSWNSDLNLWDLVSASIQTWSDEWAYREYNTTNARYENVPYSNEVWRKKKNYVWKAHIDDKGTYKNSGTDMFEDFDWTETSLNPNWKKVNEVTLYDHYSHPLESRDIVNKYISSKRGYNSSYEITSSANSRYIDFAYSGAEDEVMNSHFGGEVLKGSASTLYDAVVNINGDKYVHTGSKSLSVGNGEWAYVFRNYEYDKTKNYKASVWVHEDNAVEACLKVIIMDQFNGSNVVQYLQSIVTSNTPKSDEWYLLEIDIPSQTDPNALFMEVQAFNPNVVQGTPDPIYFDDFMVHPATAPMTSYVYDDKTGLVTSVIDNNGMAVKYEYDDAGRLIKSYKEVLNKGFVKTAEYQYNYAR